VKHVIRIYVNFVLLAQIILCARYMWECDYEIKVGNESSQYWCYFFGRPENNFEELVKR
jgi:hypothetical protein